MLIGKINELHAEAESLKQVRDFSVEWHRLAIGGCDMQGYRLTDGNLRDRVDITSPRTDVADAGGAHSRGKFKLNLF